MSTYDTPSTRAEFEERMNYMCEILKQGKMHFSREVGGVDSLLRVRYLPNRRMDLLSIDGEYELPHARYEFRRPSKWWGRKVTPSLGRLSLGD